MIKSDCAQKRSNCSSVAGSYKSAPRRPLAMSPVVSSSNHCQVSICPLGCFLASDTQGICSCSKGFACPSGSNGTTTCCTGDEAVQDIPFCPDAFAGGFIQSLPTTQSLYYYTDTVTGSNVLCRAHCDDSHFTWTGDSCQPNAGTIIAIISGLVAITMVAALCIVHILRSSLRR